MPAISPEAISNLVRLANESAALDRRLVPEHGAVDSLLAAVVDEISPDEDRVASLAAQHDFLARPNEQLSLSAVRVAVGAVVPFVEFKAVKVSVLRQPPMPHNKSLKPTLLRNAAYLQR